MSRVVAVDALSRLPDLHQKLALARELEDMGVATTVRADPDVVLGVHAQPVVRHRPGIALARPAEMAHEISLGIEFKDVGGRGTTDPSRGVQSGVRLIAWVETTQTMDDEHVVVRVHVHADSPSR